MTGRYFNFAASCRPVGDSFPGRFDLQIVNNSYLAGVTIEYAHGAFHVLRVQEWSQYNQRWIAADTHLFDLAREVTRMVTRWHLATIKASRSPATGG